MPVYVYHCDDCGLAFERRQSVAEGPLTVCPECDGRVRRVIQPVGVVFKGSGFYITDNRSHSPTIEAPPSNKESGKNGNKEPSIKGTKDSSSD